MSELTDPPFYPHGDDQVARRQGRARIRNGVRPMTTRRLPHSRATVATAGRGEDETPERPACDGEWPLFWQLIDAPTNPHTRRAAVKFCRTCPLRDKCLLDEHRGEEWAQAMVSELVRIVDREDVA